MLILKQQTKVITIILLGLFLLPVLSYSQHGGGKLPPRAMEKIQTMKKVKLLEVLELPEADADKVLVKYTSYENKIIEATKRTDEITEKLDEAVKADDYKNIEKLNDDFMKARKDLDAALDDRMNGMKQILTKEQFAKYLVFERKFQEELRRAIMERVRERKGKGPH
jgi:hypothetical protein